MSYNRTRRAIDELLFWESLAIVIVPLLVGIVLGWMIWG